VRWERPTARSFWNALADPERDALAAAGVEEFFRAGAVLCRAGDDTSYVMVIDSGWVKVSIRDGSTEKIVAVRGQGDVVGERAALTAGVRSATVTALDEVSAMVVPAERFAEFLRGHPRAAEVLQRQVTERREEDRARLFPASRGGADRAGAERDAAERRLAWLLSDLAQRRGGHQHAVFTLPMSQQELADWAGTSADAVGRFLRSWRGQGIVARSERSRRLTVIDLDGLAALSDTSPSDTSPSDTSPSDTDPSDTDPSDTSLSDTNPSVAAPSTPAPSDAALNDTALNDTAPAGARAIRPPNGSPLAAPGAADWQRTWHEPLNCAIVFTDVAGFSSPLRNDSDRDVVRAALYETLRAAFEASAVPWAACYHEDRGDGAVIVVPPAVSTQRVVDPLAAELADRLRQYNRRASEVVRIQLRVALHIGPVGKDPEGLTGQAVITTARILDAPVIKTRMAAEQADLTFAVSDYVYEHVVRNCGGRVDPVLFERMECQVKESHVSAWVRLAGPAPVHLTPPAPESLTGNLPGPRPAVPPPAALPVATLPVAPPLGKLPPEVRGREALTAELRRALRPYPWRASRAFVIAGMGGLGKSTIALAAARMARERGYRVWWVRAADTAQLTSGMLEVLRELGAPEAVTGPVREGAQTAPERAWEFLNSDRGAGRRWLLVFEGADNPAVLAGADAGTPADGTGWLRADPAGMVIVTTRIRDPRVWGTKVTLRELRPLDDEAGAEVLRDRAPEIADPGGREARELSRRLGGLPLALHLAGTYLGSPFARWSTFAGYRQALDGVELPAALTDIEEQGADIHATVQRTWDLSLDALAAEGMPQARPLLLVLSCFAPATPIPAWLLQLPPLGDLLTRRTGQADDHDERRGLTDGLRGLSRTGLVDISASSGPAGLNAVMVHLVVADANRIRLAASPAAERVAVQETAVALLEAATAGLDPVRPADWPAWRRLRAHMNAVIDLLADTLDPAVLARLLTVSAVGTEALLGAGRLAAAGKLAQASVAASAFLPGEDPAALGARGYLARTLVRRGRSGEAEEIYRDLLAARIRIQGERHLDTLATRHDLAAALGVQGRFGAAEELYRQLIGDDNRLRGPGHRETLAARASLARMIGLLGRYAEAEELSRHVLDDQLRVLGPDHPDCLSTRQNLARLAGKAGRYAEAERLYRAVLADRRRVLGDDHPDTLATRHRLSRIIGQRGRYGEAEELCHQILADRRRLLDEDHPDNLSTRHRLARVLGLQGRYADAEPMFRQVLAARRRTLGDDHPATLVTQHRLGWLIGRQGRYGEAIDLVSQALGSQRDLLGDDHPDTLAARETQAWLTALRGKPAEAGELARAVLADRRRVLGGDHPDTLTTRATVAWTAELQGRYASAEQQYRTLLADRRHILGPGHPDTLTTRQDVARMVGLQHRYAEAEQVTREILADRHRLLGDDHPDTLTSRAVLARLTARQGRRAEAEELYRQVIADRSRVLGPSHPDTGAARAELAQLVD
jgi:CRP-like cAMP-binding protein/tetratricopeptide (TPR) repeat protein